MQSQQILRAIQFPKNYERGTKSVHLLRSTPAMLLVLADRAPEAAYHFRAVGTAVLCT